MAESGNVSIVSPVDVSRYECAQQQLFECDQGQIPLSDYKPQGSTLDLTVLQKDSFRFVKIVVWI